MDTIIYKMCEQIKQTKTVNMSKIRVQQSTLSYSLNHCKNKSICQHRKTERHKNKAHKDKRKKRKQQNYHNTMPIHPTNFD